jgi:membrane protein
LGFLAIVSLTASALIDGLGDKILLHYKWVNTIVLHGANLILTIVIIALIFAIIFKVLPDAKIRWREVFVGSLVTAILFVLGKLAISLYIANSHIATYYGAAGTVIIVLLWVYYCSVILYYGAEFTKSHAFARGKQIEPAEYAVGVKSIELPSKAGPHF